MAVPSMKEPINIPKKIPIDLKTAAASKSPLPSAGEYSSIDLYMNNTCTIQTYVMGVYMELNGEEVLEELIS